MSYEEGQIIDIIEASHLEAKVGDYKWSHLDAATFSNEHLGEWLECNGQSCEGTTFETVFGNSVVPDVKTEGHFIRQAKVDRTVGTSEADAVKAHSHQYHDYYEADGVFGGAGVNTEAETGDGGYVYDLARESSETGGETRPKNIALNLYIKVNY